MPRRLALSLAVASLAFAGCGASGGPSTLSQACTSGPAPLARALARPPGRVVLADGTRLSDCVARATSEGGLQDFGVNATQVADALSQRAAGDPHAAFELGYLIGAARRGARLTNGVLAELVHRLESSAREVGDRSPAARAALARGLAAGEHDG